MTIAVKLDDVSFTYRSGAGTVQALRSVSFQIPEGAVYGLLGPNGAGKTTLLRCISGLIRPEGGSVLIWEQKPERENLSRIGVLIENPGIYRKLTAEEYLIFFGSLYGVRNIPEKIAELSEYFEVELTSKPLGKLSVGQRQKIQLLRSLLHSPKLILWDEPFSNLDPLSQRRFNRYLNKYVAEFRATAIVATHQLNQAEEICTSFGFISRGKMSYSGTREDVRRKAGHPERLIIALCREIEGGALSRLTREHNLTVENGRDMQNGLSSSLEAGSGEYLVFTGPGLHEKVPDIIAGLTSMGIGIRSVIPEKKNLYHLYRELVK
jgi:ABC-type multidrug transport system ATPase subunit